MDEVGVLEVEAMGDAAELDVGVAAEELERDFLAAIGDGEVDLAEPALADAALDGVPIQRSLAGAVGEFQSGHRWPRRRWDRLPAHPASAVYPSMRMIRTAGAEIEGKTGSRRCAGIITGWRVGRRSLAWMRRLPLSSPHSESFMNARCPHQVPAYNTGRGRDPRSVTGARPVGRNGGGVR